jgi:hypothetical protein
MTYADRYAKAQSSKFKAQSRGTIPGQRLKALIDEGVKPVVKAWWSLAPFGQESEFQSRHQSTKDPH